MSKLSVVILALAAGSSFAADPPAPAKTEAPAAAAPAAAAPAAPAATQAPAGSPDVAKELGLKPGQKLYATFKTNQGDMTAELFWDKAPKTVLNFVQLAEGKKEWTDTKGAKVKKPLYDGTLFHRVIPDFMIQGGDPEGSGRGGPGYTFEDEFVPELKLDGAGVLAMANRGPNTNGSQFFITEKATPWLNGKHTVFGKLTTGTEIVSKITHVEKGAADRPVKDVVLQKILIGRGTPKK